MKILISLVFFVLAPFAVSGGVLPSKITANTILDISGSPYQLTGNVSISKGITLLVNPGVVIKSSGNYGLFVNGTLKMMGKKDSLITVDSLYVQFDAGSDGYNPKTNSGSVFNYVRFNCAQNGNPFAIRSSKADIFASHCQFLNVNNAIYAMSDSVNITVFNSKILGFNNGYSIYNTNSNWDLHMMEDTIIYGGYIYMGKHNKVEKCLFIGGTNTYYGLYGQFHTKTANISCNYFNRVSYSINLSSISANHGKIDIYNNAIDSAYIGLYFSRDIKTDSITVSNNAFMKCDYALYCLPGINGVTAPINLTCKNNWWNNTDSAKIAPSIFDHRDNQFVIPNIEFIPTLSNPPVLCGPTYGNYGQTNTALAMVKTAIKIAPNPTQNHIDIIGDIKGPVTWYLYNTNGQLIRNGILYNQYKINDLRQPGIYILKLTQNDTPLQTYRLIVKE